MNQILYSGKKNDSPVVLIVSIVIVAFLVIFLAGFAVINMFNQKILNGVKVAGIDVSNITKEQAVEILSKNTIQSVGRNLVLRHNDLEIVVSTDEIGLVPNDVTELAEAAYQYGRNKNIFVNNFNVLRSYFNAETNIEVNSTIDKNKLEKVVDEAISKNDISSKSYYEISGDKLLITKGTVKEKIEYDVLATSIMKALESNETYIDIPVSESESEVIEIDGVFREQISTYTSKYDISNTNIATNMKLATDKCNNVILYPGDEFSFNKTVGSIGEGASQVSSTLYNAVLKADLTVTERTANKVWVKYVAQSADAIVEENLVDFKFKNDRKYPVKISTTCSNGECIASIYGIKETDEPTITIDVIILETLQAPSEKQYDATMGKGTTKVVQEGINGYTSEAYKVYLKNGKEVSRELISKDTYLPISEVVKVGTAAVVKTPSKKPTPSKTPTSNNNNSSSSNNSVNDITGIDSSYLLPPGWDNPESGY